MSELDYQHTKDHLPGAIDEIERIHLQVLPASIDEVMEVAKATEAPQFIKDAEEWARVLELNAQYIKAICGEEGDKGTETGSLQGIVTIAKKMCAAVGGDM